MSVEKILRYIVGTVTFISKKGKTGVVRADDGAETKFKLVRPVPGGLRVGDEVVLRAVSAPVRGFWEVELERRRARLTASQIAALSRMDPRIADDPTLHAIQAAGCSIAELLLLVQSRPEEAEARVLEALEGDHRRAAAVLSNMRLCLEAWAGELATLTAILQSVDPGIAMEDGLMLIVYLHGKARRRGYPTVLAWLKDSPAVVLAEAAATGDSSMMNLRKNCADRLSDLLLPAHRRLRDKVASTVLWSVYGEVNDGHTVALLGKVLGVVSNKYGPQGEKLARELIFQDAAFPVVPRGKDHEGRQLVTTKVLAWAEDTTARWFLDLVRSLPLLPPMPGDALAGLGEDQKAAVTRAFRHRLSVLTGPAGSGKTETIARMVWAAARAGAEVMVLAPTGRAADVLAGRIRQLLPDFDRCGTIHRMLSLSPDVVEDLAVVGGTGTQQLFARPALVVVDEMSMVSTTVLGYLASRLRDEDVHLVLSGDAWQLQPVGPGQPFKDVIASGICPVARLTEIRRQVGPGRALAEAAVAYLDGAPLRGDRVLRVQVPSGSAETVFRRATEVALEWMRELGEEQVLVITPLRGESERGGIAMLGQLIREALGRETESPGAWVVCRRNLYGMAQAETGETVDLFNGQRGRIVQADDATVWVQMYPGPKVRLTVPLFRRFFEDGHAITVHRSQGSEAAAVVLALPDDRSLGLACREAIYTAVTRARDRVAVVGSKTALQHVDDAEFAEDRNTRLKMLLGR